MDPYADFRTAPAKVFAPRLSAFPGPATPPARYWLLLALLGICLLSRAWVAYRWQILWPDSVVYLEISQALEKGDVDRAFRDLGVNIYPVILMWLRRTGADWIVIGQCWSVLTATLTVLPLFGWARRHFNDQVATVACLLYTVHPVLLGYSPAIIRDPTYWLLFACSLYFSWRAVMELRWWLFLAAGAALTLTVYTRFEGVLLFLVLGLWSAWRFSAIPGLRRRLVLGLSACLAVLPLSVIGVNLTLFREHPRWELGRSSQVEAHLSQLLSCANTAGSSTALPAAPAVRPPLESKRSDATGFSSSAAEQIGGDVRDEPSVGGPAHKLSALEVTRKVLLRLIKAYTYSCGVLTLVGLCCWRYDTLRRDHLPLMLQNLLLMALIWGYYWVHGGIDIRYFLPIVIVSLPYMALGLLQVADWALSLARAYWANLERRRPAVIFSLSIVVAVAGAPNVAPPALTLIRQQTELGRWILDRVGPGQVVVGPQYTHLVEYFCRGQVVPVCLGTATDRATFVRTVDAYHPKVFFLWDDSYNRTIPIPFAQQACAALGYQQVAPSELPGNCRTVAVFIERGLRKAFYSADRHSEDLPRDPHK